ncbi:hypothetical protein CBL_02847 [Carabus blaptoides fortunei]
MERWRSCAKPQSFGVINGGRYVTWNDLRLAIPTSLSTICDTSAPLRSSMEMLLPFRCIARVMIGRQLLDGLSLSRTPDDVPSFGLSSERRSSGRFMKPLPETLPGFTGIPGDGGRFSLTGTCPPDVT